MTYARVVSAKNFKFIYHILTLFSYLFVKFFLSKIILNKLDKNFFLNHQKTFHKKNFFNFGDPRNSVFPCFELCLKSIEKFLFWEIYFLNWGKIEWILSNAWKIENRPSRTKFYKPRNCFSKLLIWTRGLKMKSSIATKKYAVNLAIQTPTKLIFRPFVSTQTARHRGS